jgi:hypothetical protein
MHPAITLRAASQPADCSAPSTGTYIFRPYVDADRRKRAEADRDRDRDRAGVEMPKEAETGPDGKGGVGGLKKGP